MPLCETNFVQVLISNNFNTAGTKGIFANTGLMVNGIVTTVKTTPNYTGNFTNLGTLLENGEVPSEYLIPPTDLDRWHYLKGAKNELRKKANGFEYYYKEGAMIFPAPLDRPSRTIITGEGRKVAFQI